MVSEVCINYEYKDGSRFEWRMHENNVHVHNSKMYGGRAPCSCLSPNRTCQEMMINQHHHNLYILLSRGGGTHCLFYH